MSDVEEEPGGGKGSMKLRTAFKPVFFIGPQAEDGLRKGAPTSAQLR